MDSMKDKYSTVEGWIELGNLEEADLEFQKLTPRDLATERGLKVWIKLSRAMKRWPEMEAAANQLRALRPKSTLPILCETEALHHQGRTMEAVALLSASAACFTGREWSTYIDLLSSYVALAGLPEAQQAKFQAILKAEDTRRQLTSLSVSVVEEIEISRA